jgi:hypothetical protein
MVAMLMDTPEDRGVDNPAEIGLPASATRVLFYEDGWSDSSTWVAFSGSQMEIETYIKTQCGRSLSDLDDWKPGVSNPVSVPSRSSESNKGNWDMDKVIRGKTFSRFDGHSGLDILVDTKRWRIFLRRYTT